MSETLLGARIRAVRAMTAQELAEEGWDGHREVVALDLDSGATIYASRDDEGNGPGALFGKDAGGCFRLMPIAPVIPLKTSAKRKKSG